MCAIVDNDVRDEVFGGARSEAGRYLFDWLTDGRGKLAVGGKLRRELSGSSSFVRWMKVAQLAGRVVSVEDGRVDQESDRILQEGLCESNDPHVLALARVSRSRLLFTNDQRLQKDFRNPQIIGRPEASSIPRASTRNSRASMSTCSVATISVSAESSASMGCPNAQALPD